VSKKTEQDKASAMAKVGQAESRKAGAAVLVTGAGGGIGGAIAQRLLSDGWRVLATDVDEAGLERLRATLGDPGELRLHPLDVTERAEAEAIAATLRRDGQRLAGLVNAAGLLQDVFALLDMDPALQHRIWEVNYFGAVTCTQVFTPAIIAGGGGAIVNITSINEQRPLPLHAYAPSKVALGALTKLSAGEFGLRGVRVNAIAPGFTLTPVMQEKIRSGKRAVGAIEAATAMGRLIEMDEIAAVASFLLSDDARAVTGASIPVDAGWLASSHWMNFQALKSGPQSD